MDDYEVSPEIRQRLAELRCDPDRELHMLSVFGLQPFYEDGISPRQSFEFQDPVDGTEWDVTINETERDTWILVLLDRTRGILSDVSGSTYITPDEAYRAAHQAAGGVLPVK
jgi:hypothetical protein